MTTLCQMFDSSKDTTTERDAQQETFHKICEQGFHAMRDRDVTTRAEIYEEAIQNFRSAFPQTKPYAYLASKLFMSESTLRQKVMDDRIHFSVHEEERFFELCHFPQGFTMKLYLTFNMPMEAHHGNKEA